MEPVLGNLNQTGLPERSRSYEVAAEKSEIIAGIERSPRGHTPGRIALSFQRLVGHAFCLPVYELIALWFRRKGYLITNLKETRGVYREAFERSQRNRTPLVICANHLTFIDSCLMIWAFGSSAWFFKNYRAFSWNLPAGDFFKKKMLFRVVAYLGKCIFIHRDGDLDHKNAILEHCLRLITGGEVLTIFPEGHRSRTGRFEHDRMTYGIGKIVSDAKGCEVLCVYIRAKGQEGSMSYPLNGSSFYIRMKLIQPLLTQKGRRAYFEVLQQIGDTILQLEIEHFK